MANYTANLMPHIFSVVSDDVTNGEYNFDVGKIHDPLPFFLDGFHFVDSNGDPVVSGGGAVTVQVSSDGVLYRDVIDGTIDATSPPGSITPPSGLAPVTKVRLTLGGISGAAVGFRANLVKGE